MMKKIIYGTWAVVLATGVLYNMLEQEKIYALAELWKESSNICQKNECSNKLEWRNGAFKYDLFLSKKEIVKNCSTGVRIRKNDDMVLDKGNWVSKKGKDVGVVEDFFATEKLCVLNHCGLLSCNDYFAVIPVVKLEQKETDNEDHCNDVSMYLFRLPWSDDDQPLTFIRDLGLFCKPEACSISYDSSCVLVKLAGATVCSISLKDVPKELLISKKSIIINFDE